MTSPKVVVVAVAVQPTKSAAWPWTLPLCKVLYGEPQCPLRLTVFDSEQSVGWRCGVARDGF